MAKISWISSNPKSISFFHNLMKISSKYSKTGKDTNISGPKIRKSKKKKTELPIQSVRENLQQKNKRSQDHPLLGNLKNKKHKFERLKSAQDLIVLMIVLFKSRGKMSVKSQPQGGRLIRLKSKTIRNKINSFQQRFRHSRKEKNCKMGKIKVSTSKNKVKK